MFCSTLLLLGSMLVGPSADAQPDLRGPRWQGRTHEPTSAASRESTVVGTATSTELRDPFVGTRAAAAVVQPSSATLLRDPFRGRGGVAVAGEPNGPLPLESSSRDRSRAPIPTSAPAPTEVVDPFVTRSHAPSSQPHAPAGTADGAGLRRPFGST